MKQTIKQTQTSKHEKNFFKKHWKKIVATTVVVCGVTVSVILLYKNGNKIAKIFEYKQDKVKTSPTTSKVQTQVEPPLLVAEEDHIEKIRKMVEKSIDVNSYVRRLPENRRVSPKKKIQMEELGIFLDENHTYCDGYTKKIKVLAA